MKKLNIILSLSVGYFYSISTLFADTPDLNCKGLPGCTGPDTDVASNIGADVIGNVIGETIKYVAVFAVIALMISGILYLLSEGEEEKAKKAKNWIIWSLVGVFLSISAWSIINILNNLTL